MNKEPDLLHQSQYAILDLIEELGRAARHIREALAEHNDGNKEVAIDAANDAAYSLSKIEEQASEASATIIKWLES
jgi:uncharacterized membrane protein YccC